MHRHRPAHPMKRDATDHDAKRPLSTSHCGLPISDERALSPNRTAILLVFGPLLLLLLTLSLCFGEMVIRTVHLLAIPFIEHIGDRSSLFTSDRNLGRRATETYEQTPTKITLGMTRHRVPPPTELSPARESAGDAAERLRDREFVRSGHSSL